MNENKVVPFVVSKQPVADVVELARSLLERAEAGEIHALVAAIQHSDGMFSSETAGPVAEGYGMAGLLSHQLHVLHSVAGD